MKIEIMVSTINNTIDKISESLLFDNKTTIINQQPNKYNGQTKTSVNNGIKWIDYDDVGLSKSRNLGLNISKTDYVYLADDDIVLSENFMDIVTSVVEKNPSIDIFAFQVNGIERVYKEYSSEVKDINYLNSLNLSSVQLILNTKFVKENKLNYDELFGSGSRYKMGEENIFLFDALKKGAQIKYFPIEIAKVHLDDSTWFEGFNQKYFFDRGAIYSRMFGRFSHLFSFVFCFRKFKSYRKNISFFKAFKHTREGKRDYENISML